MSSSQKELELNSKILATMMRNLRIYRVDKVIWNHLLKLNHKCVSLILKEAKSCSKLANKDFIDTSDIQKAILKITGEDVKTAYYTLINKEFYYKTLAQFDKNSKVDLPVLTVSDVEEVIRGIKDNQDTTTYKFDVDSLLNDPYSL